MFKHAAHWGRLVGHSCKALVVRRAYASPPKASHIIGDIAVLKPGEDTSRAHELLSSRVRVVASKDGPCQGPFRLSVLRIVAGEPRLGTTHTEWGVRFRLSLDQCFFNPRLQAERRRICELVYPGERILVLFSGIGIWPIMLALRSSCREVVALELNKKAHELAIGNALSNRLSGKVRNIHADASELLDLGLGIFDRVVAPRPKDVSMDAALLSAMTAAVSPGGNLHVYAFATDAELTEGAMPVIGSDLDKLKNLTSFRIQNVTRCPRGSIGRVDGRSVYRVAVDMHRPRE